MGRSSSTGTMSSNEDADEKDGNVTSFEAQSTPKGLLAESCPPLVRSIKDLVLFY